MTQTDPLSDLQRLQSWFGRVLDDGMSSLLEDGFTPLADVEETDDAYIVEIELPGVKKKDIDISVSGRRITVLGERKERERKGILRRRTRSVGRFRYEIVLPGPVNEDGVSAALDDGVLVLIIPKTATDGDRRQVAIS
jgi:HSP20 family protein